MRKLIALLIIPSITWAGPSCTVTVNSQYTNNQGEFIEGLHFVLSTGQTYDVGFTIPLSSQGSSTPVNDFAASVCNNLISASSNFTQAPSVGQTVIPTTSQTPPINPFAAQESQFLSDFHLLQQYKEAINYGLITSADSTYTNLLSSATNEYAVIKDTVTNLMPSAQ